MAVDSPGVCFNQILLSTLRLNSSLVFISSGAVDPGGAFPLAIRFDMTLQSLL